MGNRKRKVAILFAAVLVFAFQVKSVATTASTHVHSYGASYATEETIVTSHELLVGVGSGGTNIYKTCYITTTIQYANVRCTECGHVASIEITRTEKHSLATIPHNNPYN